MEYGNYQWCIYLGGGAKNAPDTVALTGSVIKQGNLIVQQIYPEDSLTDEMIFYVRKGFINGDNITWSKWYITNLYLEEAPLTRILKGYDTVSSTNLFNKLIPSSTTSIIFTDITMPSSATLIDVDEDGDGGVVAWMDGTTMYVSTQKSGTKVEANKNSSEMFSNKSNLTSIDFSNFDTSYVTDMNHMFNYYLATILDLSNWDTSNVTNMLGMFYGCWKLTTLDVSNFNTSKVTNMADMFSSCSALTTLNVSNFNTSKVTDMGMMFNSCSALTTLDVSNFNTSKVTNMSYMFQNCIKLTTLDLSNWDTSNVTDMANMFYGCRKLNTIKVADKFKWVNTLGDMGFSIWQDETGTQYTSSDTFPSNVVHTYTKVS